MSNQKRIMAALIAGALAGAAMPAAAETEDGFLWLEEVEGAKALDWVKGRNDATFARLKADPRYEKLRAEAERILTAKDRIPYGVFEAGKIDNFWQDETHVRGLWRRATLDSYRTDTPAWDVILDVDALAKAEGENWIYKSHDCLPPEGTRCLVSLSRGGKDATVVREFDAAAKRFVEGGFSLPEAKQWVDWADKDSLLVATDYGDGTMTASGYPRQVRLWKRGTDLAQAPVLLDVGADDVWATPSAYHRKDGDVLLLERAPDFFTQEWHHVGKDGTVAKLGLPLGIELKGVIDEKLLLLLRQDWTVGGTTLRQGSIVAVPVADALGKEPGRVEILIEPDAKSAIQDVEVGDKAVYVHLLENVGGKVLRLTRGKDGWKRQAIDLPENGAVTLVSVSSRTDAALVKFNSFLQPDTLYLVPADGKPEVIKSLPPRFDASPYVTEQRFATSKDGTRVPYFITRAKGMKMNGDNPTLLYGYGGFESPVVPAYLIGKSASAPVPVPMQWVQAGGVYVVANIRGGGEFGPGWHQAALKENRQKAFDDFIAVAEDLIRTKVTRPERLGISGRSNGGLLVGAAFTQRPELFGAVICGVPLLDMLRYHKLLAGASWMGEYGNPDVDAEQAYLKTYSPYQNLNPGRTYPEVLFYTSTKDDRVHPGHARKMAARMEEMGKPVLYYENMEGGHAGSANAEQLATLSAVQIVYLMQKLMEPAPRS